MIANLLNIAFIGLLALWFSTQGLFSALLHLVLTVLAGAIAFACWEPLVYDYLLARMPEIAWSAGLIAPFVLALLLLRLVTDKLVPGNVKFPPLADQIGGGAVGFLSGVLTAGLLLIGMSYNAPFSFGSFERYQLDGKGEQVVKDSLWISSDTIASSVFGMLADGSLSPAFADITLASTTPNLAEQSGAFRLTSRSGARATIMPEHVKIEQSLEIAADKLKLGTAKPVAGARLIAISTTHDYEANADLPSDLDTDLYFTATRAQVVLLASDKNGQTIRCMPVGFIYRNDYGNLQAPGEFARSRKNPAQDTFQWLFHLPLGFDPTFLRIKQVRLPLPDLAVYPPKQSAEWAAPITWTPSSDSPTPPDDSTTTPDPVNGVGADVKGIEVSATSLLPVELSKNWVNTSAQNVELIESSIVTAVGTVRFEAAKFGIGPNLMLNSIHHDSNSAMVRVILAPDKASSIWGKAIEFAAQTQMPLLVTAKGDTYQASGWIRYNRDEAYLSFTGRRIRAMSELDTKSVGPNDKLAMYFVVNPGDHIAAFKIGSASEQKLNLTLPR